MAHRPAWTVREARAIFGVVIGEVASSHGLQGSSLSVWDEIAFWS